MSQAREQDRWTPPESPYVSDGRDVAFDHGDVRQLARAMRTDATAFGGDIGKARAMLFGDMGFDTAPTFGVDPRNPRAAQMMKFHNAAFERAVGAADDHVAVGEAVGGAIGLAGAALSAADETAAETLDSVGGLLRDGLNLFTGDSEGD